MGEAYKQVLDKHKSGLTSDIDFEHLNKDNVLLVDKGGFLNDHQYLLIGRNRDNEARMHRMLVELKDKGEDEFRVFCLILELRGYKHWSILLKEEAGFKRKRSKYQKTSSSSAVDERRSSFVRSSRHDRAHSAGSYSTSSPATIDKGTCEFEVKVQIQTGSFGDDSFLNVTVTGSRSNSRDPPSSITAEESSQVIDEGSDCDLFDGDERLQCHGQAESNKLFRSPNNSVTNCGSPTSTTVKTLEDFHETFKGKLQELLSPKQVAAKMFDEHLIPEDLREELSQGNSTSKCNSTLLQHMKTYFEFEEYLKFSEIVQSLAGYPKLQRLGREMKMDLEKHESLYKDNFE